MDQVFMKKTIKKDTPFENHPNLIFGLISVAIAVLLLASIFLLDFLPFWLLILLWIVVIGLAVYWIVQKNESANLTKSSAFILRNGILYYIRLGYALDGEIPIDALEMVFIGPVFAMNSARATENIAKTNLIEQMRKKPEIFSNYLTQILRRSSENTGLPPYVIQFCTMMEPKLEKVDTKWIWISYCNQWSNGKRTTQKFRNVYDDKLQKILEKN